MQLKQGILIAFEGIDGSGKSTLTKNVFEQLKLQNIDTILTKEPGGTPLGIELRKILLNREVYISPKAEFLLFASDRAQHNQEVIAPNLQQNKLILSDRMADSSLIYQGIGRGLDLDILQKINSWAMGDVSPDITFYIRIDANTAFERINSRNETKTSFEKEKRLFFERLINGFEKLYYGRKDVFILDGTRSESELAHAAVLFIKEFLETRSC